MKTLRWGILPASSHFNLRVLQPMSRAAGAEIVAVASRDGVRAEAAAEAIDAVVSASMADSGKSPTRVRAYASYESLLADPDVDAVYISLPNNLHLEWTLKALAAGKHVLCEKPFGLNAVEARRASDAGRASCKLVMEAFMYRFHPQWRRAKEIIMSSEIGKPTAVEVSFSYNNKDPRNIRNRPENGGGALYDIGCYAVSCARWLMGAEPSRVFCSSEYDPDFGTDRLSSGILDFGGASATFTVGTQSASFQQVVVLGDKGSVLIRLPFNAYPDTPLQIEVKSGVGERIVDCGPSDQYRSMVEAFSYAALSGSQVPPTPMSDSIANMAVLDALFASASSATWAPVKI